MSGQAAAELSDATLRLALSLGDIALWEFDIETREIRRSPELNLLHGFPADAAPSFDDYMARCAPGEEERIRRLAADAAARGDTRIDFEIRHLWPDGTTRWLMIRAESAPGSSRRALGVALDITKRKLAEEALARSERRLRLAQAAAGIASFELDIASGWLVASDNFWPLWGLPKQDRIQIDDLQEYILPEFSSTVSNLQTRRAGTVEPTIEFRLRRADTGEQRWMARELEFVRDEQGRPVTMFGVVHDITASKAAEERQALLTHELQHRIKNILATVSAIATQTLREGSLEQAREAFTQRIKALSEAHNLLTSTDWTDASLRGVLESSLAPHDVRGRVRLLGYDLRLTPRMALSLALAVNELATNALKYGSLSNDCGRVEVAWEFVADTGSDRELRWVWRESGGPAVSPPQRRGFGSVLIERVLAADFGGLVEVDYAPEGVVMQLRAPAMNLRPAGT